MNNADTDRIIDEIKAERIRQQDVEGWTPDHDDQHSKGEMTRAALNYAGAASICMTLDANRYDQDQRPPLDFFGSAFMWPWAAKWWKPKTVRRDLIRAAALIVAEIERLDRRAIADLSRALPKDDGR